MARETLCSRKCLLVPKVVGICTCLRLSATVLFTEVKSSSYLSVEQHNTTLLLPHPAPSSGAAAYCPL